MGWGFLISLFALTVHAEVLPLVQVSQPIQFEDDLRFEQLTQAIDRQMDAYQRRAPTGTLTIAGKVFQKSILIDSLTAFKKLAVSAQDCLQQKSEAVCLAEFNQSVQSQFNLYSPKKQTQFTSYYSPDLHGSRVKTAKYARAIYQQPPANLSNFTRVAIDYHQALAQKQLELFWVEESFYDLYLLHVQGGGRIHIENADGTTEIKYLSYAGKNSQPFRMVYKYMVEKGYLKGDAGVPAQRQFLQDHPEKEEEVFSSCPSYVYFKESDSEPEGLDSIPLTEGRSNALDRSIYQTTGLINFVKTVKTVRDPITGVAKKVPFGRFFIGQDTGGAIKGEARADLYSGYGPEAELIAYSMNDLGEQYFLIKK